MERFDFSYAEYQRLLQQCPFTQDEMDILDLRRRGWSVVQISFKLNLGTRAIDRRIASIKKKIQKETV